MNFNHNRGALGTSGTILIAALLAMTGCNGKDKAAGAPSNASGDASATAASHSTAANPADQAGSAASKDYVDERMQEMDRRHRQEMDHSDMRMGRMRGDNPQQSDSPPAPMSDM